MDLRHIIDDLKITAEDPDDGEDKRGSEFREKKLAFVPEYLSTKKITCLVCNRSWTVVIYFVEGKEILLHPTEAKCSFCMDAAKAKIAPSPGSSTIFHMEEHAAAYKRLCARAKCVRAKIDRDLKEVTYVFSDNTTVVMPLEEQC